MLTKFYKNYSFLQSAYMPYIKINFYDNPYLLNTPESFDYYTLKVPLHIYLKTTNNKIIVYSMTQHWVDYNNNKEFLSHCTNRYLPQMKTLINNFTINNQNVKADVRTISSVIDKVTFTSGNNLPAFIFPTQLKNPQYKVNKGFYDIKTLIRMDKEKESISSIWKKSVSFTNK